MHVHFPSSRYFVAFVCVFCVILCFSIHCNKLLCGWSGQPCGWGYSYYGRGKSPRSCSGLPCGKGQAELCSTNDLQVHSDWVIGRLPLCLQNSSGDCCSPRQHSRIGWYWVLGVHKLLPQGPVGTECNLDGKGGQDPTDGLGQSTDVGESHRSTGHLVTWSPLIRLWAGVLVYETLGVTISLEGLGHQLLLLGTTHS